jgi:EAL and modified HD-GYP domain-containing signal transduction protein
MDVHVARQPIFDSHQKLFAYKLLIGQASGSGLEEPNRDRTTSSLLTTAFLTEGIEQIAGSTPCCIRFTENLLLQHVAAAFPKNRLIIDIPADVPASAEVVEACRTLAHQGYIVALDDSICKKERLPLLELANIIKLDCQGSTWGAIERTMHRLAPFNLKFLAEGVESFQELEIAQKLGFNYFQGYFFACPQSLRITEVASNKANLLRLLAEVNKPQFTIASLEQIIAADVAIAYKLLRYINSAFFSLLHQVESIHQAIVYLGEREIRRFVTLMLIAELAVDKPTELVRLSVIRARFCELLAAECRDQEDNASELFLLGLFSLIDALLDAPMALMMEKLPLSDRIKEALMLRQGPFAPFLAAAIAYEKGRTEDCLIALGKLRVNRNKVYDIYLDAIKFSTRLD